MVEADSFLALLWRDCVGTRDEVIEDWRGSCPYELRLDHEPLCLLLRAAIHLRHVRVAPRSASLPRQLLLKQSFTYDRHVDVHVVLDGDCAGVSLQRAGHVSRHHVLGLEHAGFALWRSRVDTASLRAHARHFAR